jgi:hypothetical protein
MGNLARNRRCDTFIREELRLAGVTIVENGADGTGEVPARVTGKFDHLAFKRAWYYWGVKGAVPADVAFKLWHDPIGRHCRVAGTAGGDDPTRYVVTRHGERVVCDYHIDTQDGLNLFVRLMREHLATKQ